MDITEISIIHHVGIVLFLLWLLSFFNRCHPFAYFISLIYLYSVHERYLMRLRRKLQYQERKQANQKRALSDSESVRWLNHAVEKIWPICMEKIVSQKILLPIVPWFLNKYKPWTAKKAVVQSMYLGRSPPMFTDMRVLRQCTGDDHLVLELGMSFCAADDMSAVLAVKLRRRLGFGMWTKLHMTAMHVEGKVVVGVKFLRHWPFLGRLRVCFAESPYFQMTVKPIFTHGLDVTELPLIAGWLDKLLSVAFEQTLVQPNMLVVDMEKFVAPETEDWFSVDEKEPVAHAKVEVVEASDMKPSDLNGLADPYVKGQLGPYKFRTKIQKKTLAPKWQEEFRIPICTWDASNVLVIQVLDKDHFVDDTLGDCTVNINDFRDGERHDMWLPLENIKMGRLHLAITVEGNAKGSAKFVDVETLVKEEMQDDPLSDDANGASFSSSSTLLDKSPRGVDNFEPINIEGQQETGIWVQRPGSEIPQTWEPRKGKSMRLDNQGRDSFGSLHSPASGSLNNDNSVDENAEGKILGNRMQRGLRKISAVLHRGHRNEDNIGSNGETVISPYANIKAVNQKEIGVNFIVEDSLSGPTVIKNYKESALSPERAPETPGRGNMKDMAKSIFKHAEKSARTIKHVLSRKESRRSQGNSSVMTEIEISPDSNSSDDESLSPSRVRGIPIVSTPTFTSHGIDDCDNAKQNTVQAGIGSSDNTKQNTIQAGSNEVDKDTDVRMEKANIVGLERIDENGMSSMDGGDRQEELSKPQVSIGKCVHC